MDEGRAGVAAGLARLYSEGFVKPRGFLETSGHSLLTALKTTSK
jgi:hypothetical protein